MVCCTGLDLVSGGFLRESDDWMATPRFSDLGDGGGYVIPRDCTGERLRCCCCVCRSHASLLLLLQGKEDEVGMEAAEAATASGGAAAVAAAAEAASPPICTVSVLG